MVAGSSFAAGEFFIVHFQKYVHLLSVASVCLFTWMGMAPVDGESPIARQNLLDCSELWVLFLLLGERKKNRLQNALLLLLLLTSSSFLLLLFGSSFSSYSSDYGGAKPWPSSSNHVRSPVFWDITQCSVVIRYRCFRDHLWFPLQRSRNPNERT